jgi:adenosylmethionine-8-amino-7-oxononanoate aminotransferase
MSVANEGGPSVSEADPFHLSRLEGVRTVTAGLSDTCLAPDWPLGRREPGDYLSNNTEMFTRGGSVARGYWADRALGSRIQGRLPDGSDLEMLDLCSMTCNTVLGTNDAWVKLRQASFLLSDHPHYLPARIGSDLFHRVAQRILSRLDRFGDSQEFVINLRQCNGSDAVELGLHAAWRAARDQPGKRRLATFRGGYHGESVIASLIAEDDPAFGSGRALVDRVDNVTTFASPESTSDGDLTPEAEATLDELDRSGDQYFAVIIEPIQWRNSVHMVPIEFLRRLRDICTRKSICLVFDEVQNAFGYTGSVFYAETSGVCPDVMATGKALTSGHGALAIVVARRAYSTVEAPFGSKTNAGDMLSFVAVDAVLDRLSGMFPEELARVPDWLPDGLRAELEVGLLTTRYDSVVGLLDTFIGELQAQYPALFGSASGLGLVRGLAVLDEIGRPSGDLAAAISDRGIERGVYVRRAGHAIYLKPSLSTTAQDLREAGARLAPLLDELSATHQNRVAR